MASSRVPIDLPHVGGPCDPVHIEAPVGYTQPLKLALAGKLCIYLPG